MSYVDGYILPVPKKHLVAGLQLRFTCPQFGVLVVEPKGPEVVRG